MIDWSPYHPEVYFTLPYSDHDGAMNRTSSWFFDSEAVLLSHPITEGSVFVDLDRFDSDKQEAI